MVDRRERTRLSRRLSYLLRHHPEAAGLRLDPAGWAPVEQVLAGMAARGRPVTRDQLAAVAGGNRRFEISADGSRIRARYGHSVAVDPGHPPAVPPDVLYHGTVVSALPAILREGLRPMGRRQVHLSETPRAARRVGGRRGRPVVVAVDAAGLVADGWALRRAAGGVWLVDRVPPGRLRRYRPDGAAAPSPCEIGRQQPGLAAATSAEEHMNDSVYKVIQLVGTSPESWEQAASNAVRRASSSLRDLRVAEVTELDMVLEDGVPVAYRAKVNVSFKYGGE